LVQAAAKSLQFVAACGCSIVCSTGDLIVPVGVACGIISNAMPKASAAKNIAAGTHPGALNFPIGRSTRFEND
jgi:hypothetical protein